MKDDFDPKKYRLSNDDIPVTKVTPRKVRKRREQFVQMPWTWVERLQGARGATYQVAVRLLYLAWKQKCNEVKLANGMLEFDGISRFAKYRALAALERRGLVKVERPPRKSPIVHIL